jgi:hypothetical protein
MAVSLRLSQTSSPSTGEDRDGGVLKQILRSPLPCLPRQGEGMRVCAALLLILGLAQPDSYF